MSSRTAAAVSSAARSVCDHADAVRNLIFLGTPNCGTDLANPKNWGSFADLLVNMTGIDSAELFGRLAGLLAQLAAAGVVSDVPGLLAQSPEAASTDGSFLNRLQKSDIDHNGSGTASSVRSSSPRRWSRI